MVAAACGGGHRTTPKTAADSQAKTSAESAPRPASSVAASTKLAGNQAYRLVAPEDKAMGPRWKKLAGALFKASVVEE